MGRFGEKLPKVHEQGKLGKTKPLHVMEETIDSKSLQRTMKEAAILHDTLLEARP